MLKLIAFGTLGYAALRFLKAGKRPTIHNDAPRLAGGPLSSRATVQSTPDAPPPNA